MKRFDGIAAKIETQIGRMKNKEHQAFVQSRVEAMQNSREIKEAMESSIARSKKNFKQ
jgi:hypothetical protein